MDDLNNHCNSLMRIGIPREIKDLENRVALIPSDVQILTKKGVTIFVTSGAGIGSGYEDVHYQQAGAKIYSNNRELYRDSDAIFKIKEPLENEWQDLRKGQILFAYLQAHTRKSLTQFFLDKKITAFAYEDIEAKNYRPLMIPMSTLAGRVGVIMALYHSIYHFGGEGLVPMPGLKKLSPKVMVFGAGGAGRMVIETCESLGFEVIVMVPDLCECKDLIDRGITCLVASQEQIIETLPKVSIIFNCVRYSKGLRLISKNMMTYIHPKALIIDIDAEPNGAIETSRPSTFDNPIYEVDGIRHLTIDNLPAAFPATASRMMSSALVQYVEIIANSGINAVSHNEALRTGLNFHEGQVFSKKVADAYGMKQLQYNDK